MKRVFLIVLDSYGIGAMPDAYLWDDQGTNTLGAIRNQPEFDCPNLKKLGLFNIDGVGGGVESPQGCFARMAELSPGKDTTTGHWEMAGNVLTQAFPTYPDGFPQDVIRQIESAIGRKVLCNKPYSGTDVIRDYGKEHIASGCPIVYTSADSVFQIAAHDSVVSQEELYEMCQKARDVLQGKHAVGRVIARPFTGEWPYTRTSGRHDFSLEPKHTMLDDLKAAGCSVISVGKIYDIFAGKGLTESNRTTCNKEGMDFTLKFAGMDFEGLCFTNLVDFDMNYGHRNDVTGYAKASTAFDRQLGELLTKLREGDLLIITADHGCDPSFLQSTDHSREYTPMIAYGPGFARGVNLGTRTTFSDISATILDYFGLPKCAEQSESFLSQIL